MEKQQTGVSSAPVTLDRNNRQPLYEQLKRILLTDIQRRENGEMMPTEKELCIQYGISRQTVRQTFKRLSDEGLLIRTAGRGTVVSHPKIARDNGWALENFNLEMREHGIRAETRVLLLEVIPGSAFFNNRLGLDRKERLIFLRRLRFTNGWPYVIADSYLPYERLAGLEKEQAALEQESLHILIEKNFQYIFTGADRSVEAIPVSAREAGDLGILPGSPILYSETVWHVSGGFAVEFVMEWYRGDRSCFTMTLGKKGMDTGGEGSGQGRRGEMPSEPGGLTLGEVPVKPPALEAEFPQGIRGV
ncbi:MAG: GntR family transcriptional regulator [Treponema sp.]|nr:GntR family transcriptional regulator [Treponema sp.]